jgi:ABC-2 type transport system permease protein
MNEIRVVARWQFREALRPALVWGAALAALSVLEVAIYPSVHKSLAKVIADYPRALREAFNVNDFSTVESFLDAEMFSLIVPLAAGFFAIRSTTRALAGAEERHWLDVLLSAPLTRAELAIGAFAGTAAALVVMLVAVAVPTEIAGIVAGAAPSVDLLAAGLASVWVLALLCAAFAVVGAGLDSRAATVTAGAMGVVVTMYAVDLAGKLAPALEGVRWISAFRYTESALQNGLDVGGALAVVAVAFVSAWGGIALFGRKDIAS